MMFYETSAVQGLCVEEAFYEMAKAALKRDAEQQISMPQSIGDAGGSLKLDKKDHKKRGQTQTKANCC